MKKTSVLLMTLLLLAAVFLSACGQPAAPTPAPGDPAPPQPVKVRVTEVIHSVFYAPQYVALHQGFFAEEGLDVELGIAWGADKGAAALLSNSADIGLFGPEAAIYIAAQQAETRVKAFAQLTKRDGSFLIGREADPDFQWENVRGSTIIGGRKGGVPQMVLEYVLKQHEITPFEEVEILQNIALDATAAAFAGGTGDYVQVWEPGGTSLEQAGKGHILVCLGEGLEVPYTVFHATDRYIEENPAVIQQFTNAIYKAQLWMDQTEAEEIAQVIASEFPDTSVELLTQVIEKYQALDIWKQDPVLLEQDFDTLQDIMLSAGELSVKQAYAEVVLTSYAETAVQTVTLD